MIPRTHYDKLWNSHAVHVEDDGKTLPYIDRRLVRPEMAAAAAIAARFVDVRSWH